jgi:hypothetical protein
VNDEHLTMLDDCETRESRLSDSDREKVQSLREWMESGKALTTKQAEMLDAIWERATANG